jgi:hypothetical protein
MTKGGSPQPAALAAARAAEALLDGHPRSRAELAHQRDQQLVLLRAARGREPGAGRGGAARDGGPLRPGVGRAAVCERGRPGSRASAPSWRRPTRAPRPAAPAMAGGPHTFLVHAPVRLSGRSGGSPVPTSPRSCPSINVRVFGSHRVCMESIAVTTLSLGLSDMHWTACAGSCGTACHVGGARVTIHNRSPAASGRQARGMTRSGRRPDTVWRAYSTRCAGRGARATWRRPPSCSPACRTRPGNPRHARPFSTGGRRRVLCGQRWVLRWWSTGI